jgi:hypothetical protein
MKIQIETVPHDKHRYETVGDYWEADDGVLHVRVSEMDDWRYVILVAVHEVIEMMLTRYRGISEEEISKFDIAFEMRKARSEESGEAGDHPAAPYRKEHFFATNVERLLAAELGVDWSVYERTVDALGEKKPR